MKRMTDRRKRVAFRTAITTIAVLLVSVLLDLYDLTILAGKRRELSLFINALVPAALTAPVAYRVFQKIETERYLRQELERRATTDSLTAVLNRGAFISLVEAELHQRHSKTVILSGTLLMIDVDHFKTVNDRYGHQVGDGVLKSIAATVKKTLGPNDLIGRMGGEEFCIFLPTLSAFEAEESAERIRRDIERLPKAGVVGVPSLSVSVGGVNFSDIIGYEELYSAADSQLYLAKGRGRNRVEMLSLQRA